MNPANPREKGKGQLSLEFMLLLAAFLSFLFLLLPAIEEVLRMGSYGVDAKAAELFLNRARQSSERLLAFAEGSTEEIEAFALHEWRLSAGGGEFDVEIGDGEYRKKLGLKASPQLAIPPFTFTGKFALRLTKEGGFVSGSIVEGN